jgi:hypothetical protein
MKKLNENGIQKLNNYLISEYGKNLNDDLDDNILKNLKEHGIIINGKDIIVEEITDVTEVSKVNDIKDNDLKKTTDYSDDKQLKELVIKILPYIAEKFATKEEVNNALNDLRSTMVEPEELTKLFRDISLKVKGSQRRFEST